MAFFGRDRAETFFGGGKAGGGGGGFLERLSLEYALPMPPFDLPGVLDLGEGADLGGRGINGRLSAGRPALPLW
jgi:hypothetical protein